MNGQIVDQLDNAGENLIRQINTVEIREIAPLTDGSYPYLTTEEFLEYARLGANLFSDVIIKDSSQNISSLLWSNDPDVLNLHTNIAGLLILMGQHN